MSKFFKHLARKAKEQKNKIVAAGTVAIGTAQAQAAMTVPTLNTDDAMAVAGAVLGGLAIIWGGKAAIRFIRG